MDDQGSRDRSVSASKPPLKSVAELSNVERLSPSRKEQLLKALRERDKPLLATPKAHGD